MMILGRHVLHLLVLVIVWFQTDLTEAQCAQHTSVCYFCTFDDENIEVTRSVTSKEDCLTELTSSSYQVATFDASTAECHLGDTNEDIEYTSSEKVTYRQTTSCATGCDVYSWSRIYRRQLDGSVDSTWDLDYGACMAACADTQNCQMLHYSHDEWECGHTTSCGTNCDTSFAWTYGVYTRWCYTSTDCGFAPAVTNGYVFYTDARTDVGATVAYGCTSGYVAANTNTRTCLSDGTWSLDDFTCNLPGGYVAANTNTRTCLNDGTWYLDDFTCNLPGRYRECGAPSTVANGEWSHNGTQLGMVANITCSTGYLLYAGGSLVVSGVGSSQCSSVWWIPNPFWSPQSFACTAVDCGVPSLVNGGVTYSGTTYGHQVDYTCDTGYYLSSGDETRTCVDSGSWNGTQPVCSIRDCGPLQSPANGSVSAPSTTYTQQATYTCDTGYDIQGVAVRTCNSSGLWGGVLPTCQLVDCGHLTAPSNGSVNVSLTTFTQQATFICDLGFFINGSVVVECTSSGSWNDTTTCDLMNCGSLSTIAQGYVNHTSTTFGSSAIYSCNTGYEITSGSIERVCTAAGVWNGTEPVCSMINCGPLSSPTNGGVSYTVTTYNSMATYTCDMGYQINGTATRTCQADKLWSNTQPWCQIVDCGLPAAPNNGSVNATLTTYSEQATFSCNDGFYINGTQVLECTATANWNDTLPTCAPVDCGSLTDITQGFVNYTQTTFGNKAHYACNTGYEITSGNTARVCNSSAQWNGTEPACSKLDCEPLSAPVNGSVTYPSTTYLAHANYACDTGYAINGTSSRTCQANKQWSDSEPTCDVIDCGPLANPVNGTVSTPSTLYSSKATYSCNQGYARFGTKNRICSASGTWNGNVPTCVYVDCGPLTPPENGSVTFSETFFADTANYSCDIGYQLYGVDIRACNSSGHWDPSEPECLIPSCAPLANQTSGYVTTVTETLVGSVAVYDCVAGFNLTGSSTRECQTNLSWSGKEPTCEPVDCGSLTSPADGSVTTPGGTVYPEVAQYSCNTGFIRSGPSARVCQADGTWNETTPICTATDCGVLSPPVHGHVSTMGGTTYSHVATYTCSTGYVISGQTTRTCQAGGTWSGAAPSCVLQGTAPQLIYLQPCLCNTGNSTFANLTQDEIIAQLVADTAINVDNTSSARAKFECQDDPRGSSAALGALGVALLVLVLVLALGVDLVRVCEWYSARERLYKVDVEPETRQDGQPEHDKDTDQSNDDDGGSSCCSEDDTGCSQTDSDDELENIRSPSALDFSAFSPHKRIRAPWQAD